ncbi:MAG: hypothetical protein K6A42_01025 [Treponema sp.]|nr:hypothetical protein [Treponema sp.]
MKKTLKIVLALAAMSLAFAFSACKNTSDDSAALLALASATNAAASTTTYTGSISGIVDNGASRTFYCTFVATTNSYTLKGWINSAKTGEPNINSTGTFTISGNTLSGIGSDHTLSGTSTDGGATWSFTAIVPGTGTFTGTFSKQ